MIFGGRAAPTRWDWNFRLFGIPVRIHPLFWVVMALFQLDGEKSEAYRLIAWIPAVFISILVHELGHAFAMRHHGYEPSITLYGMGGYAEFGGRCHGRLPGFWGRVFISAAGPGAGFLLAGVVAALVMLAGGGIQVRLLGGVLPELVLAGDIGSVLLRMIIVNLFFVCMFWGYLNLLPIQPLDGGHISGEICLRLDVRNGSRTALFISVVTASIMAVVAVTVWERLIAAIFFGLLAFLSYRSLKEMSQSPW